MKRFFIILPFLCCLVISCSESKISYEEATELIKKHIENSNSVYCGYSLNYEFAITYGFTGSEKENQLMQLYIDLHKQNLGTYTKKPSFDYTFHSFRPSREKYNGVVPMTVNHLDTIIGISQKEDIAQVKYRVKAVATEFYQLQILLTKGMLMCPEKTWEEDLTLVKYDTGWNVKEEKDDD